MYKKLTAMLLAGLIALQGSFVTAGEPLPLMDENVPAVGTPDGPYEDAGEEIIPEEEEVLLEEDTETTENDSLQEESVFSEIIEDANWEDNPESAEQIEESASPEDLIPEENDEQLSSLPDDLVSSSPKRQAADDFMRAAGTILASMSSSVDEPDMVGFSQLTKDSVTKALKDYIKAHGKADEEGDYYITESTSVDGVAVTANIYDVVKYDSFFFEMFFTDTIEGTKYISTIWMSVAYGAGSAADISYFMDLAATEEVYVSASAEISVPSKYKGTESIEFSVDGLDQDLMDYEIQDLANSSLKAGFSFWNSILLNKVKVSMQTLGFESYRMTHTHKYEESVLTKADFSTDGHYRIVCSSCGNIKSDKTVGKIASCSLNVTKFIYNGTVQKPNVVVKDKDGNVISSSFYNVTYSNENSKSLGTYSVTVEMKGRYSGSRTLNYSIAKASSQTPAQPKLVAAYNSVKGIGVQFYKTEGAKQYVIFRKYQGSWSSIRTIGASDPALSVSGDKLFYIDTSVKNNFGEGYIYSVASKVGSEVSSYDPKGVAIYRLDAPKLKKAVKESAGSCTVSWEKTSALGYELQYCEANASKLQWKKCPQTKNLTQTVTGLKTGTRYAFRVRCYKTNTSRGTYFSHYSNVIYLTM